MRSELIFQTPYWFIIFCFLAGGAYAFFLYGPEASWSKKLNYGLALLRGVAVAIIVFLLLSPLVRRTESIVDRAKIVFAIDNSESVDKPGKPLLPQIASAMQELSTAGYEVSLQTLDKSVEPSGVDSIIFNEQRTDLSGLLQTVRSNFEGRNLTDVVMLSDGISNQGVSPTFGQFPFKIHSLAVGDTVPQLDIRIKDVVHNRVAYLGNEFPIRVDILANGLQGKSTLVSLKQAGRTIATQTVAIDRVSYFKSLEFKTSSRQKGVQHYTIELDNIQGESSVKNNRRDVYIDIIDGRQKILLLALTPHPDVKALRSLIENNDNYELDVKVLTAAQSATDEASNKPYDLVILHQIPNVLGLGNPLVRKYVDAKRPVLYILGNQSAVPLLNTLNKSLSVNVNQGQFDKVTAHYNPAFEQINFDDESMKLLERLPPLSVPFGEYAVLPGSETILYQRVGSVNTTKPLLLLNTSGEQKVAILTGEGIWQWRQEEYALTSKHELVDNLFQKVIQILSARDDKRKFRVYPVRAEFEAGEEVVFQTEIYNDIYEPVYGQEVKLDITDESGKTKKYTYVHSVENPRFNISGLADGVYRFQASVVVKGSDEKVNGQFVVRRADIEMANTTADFDLLRALSTKSGGRFVRRDDLATLVKDLQTNRAADRLDSTEDMVELIHLKWLFALILVLLGAEWALRKYHGGY